MKVRLKFSKNGIMRFVGHLDTVRYFQKALRRSGLNLAWSNGLSPHLLVTFASPLSVGMTTEGDYIDIVLDEEKPVDEVLSLISAQLSEGFSLSHAVRLKDDAKTPMALLRAASYSISPNMMPSEDFTSCVRVLDDFLAQDEISVTKKSKKGEQTVDIKPIIFAVHPSEGQSSLYLQAAAGSIRHLKPELFMETLMRFSGLPKPAGAEPPVLNYHRLDLYGIADADGRDRTLPDPASLTALSKLDIDGDL